MKPATRALVAIVLVAGAGPAGFLLYRMVLGNQRPPLQPQLLSSPSEAAPPGSSAPGQAPHSAPVPQAAGAAQNPAATSIVHGPLPRRLPDFVLADSAGVQHSLGSYRGHPLVLNFWATWCEPCRREIPLLKSLRQQHRAEDLQIVGVAMDFRADVLRYAHDQAIDYPLLMGEDKGLALVNALGLDTVLPFTLFVDRSGDIVTVKLGELHADEAALILGRLQDIDTGRLTLQTAQQNIADGMRDLAIARARQSAATIPLSLEKS